METPCVYTKHSFLKSNSHDRNLHYKLCVAINHVIPNEIKAAQQIRGLWKIYLTTQDAKETLVRNGFRFNNNLVKIYTYDPFTQQTKPSEKVVFKDVPLDFSNEVILKYLAEEHPHISLRSKVISAKIVDDNNVPTPYMSGDRFMYVESGFDPGLPSDVTSRNEL